MKSPARLVYSSGSVTTVWVGVLSVVNPLETSSEVMDVMPMANSGMVPPTAVLEPEPDPELQAAVDVRASARPAQSALRRMERAVM